MSDGPKILSLVENVARLMIGAGLIKEAVSAIDQQLPLTSKGREYVQTVGAVLWLEYPELFGSENDYVRVPEAGLLCIAECNRAVGFPHLEGDLLHVLLWLVAANFVPPSWEA